MQEALLAFKAVQQESFPHLVYEITISSETGPTLLVQENYNTRFVVVSTSAFGPSEAQQGACDFPIMEEIKKLADDCRMVIGCDWSRSTDVLPENKVLFDKLRIPFFSATEKYDIVNQTR